MKRIFAKQALSTFKTTAAIAPSSRYLAQAMVKPISGNSARVVVELGAGTGVMTKLLLDFLPDDASLIVFEINKRFFDYLKKNFSDPRLILINASVEKLGAELKKRGVESVNAVVSSLGLGYFSERERHSLLNEINSFLELDGLYTQFQYVHCLQFQQGRLNRFKPTALFQEYFTNVHRKTTWRNLPPAFVFTCYK